MVVKLARLFSRKATQSLLVLQSRSRLETEVTLTEELPNSEILPPMVVRLVGLKNSLFVQPVSRLVSSTWRTLERTVLTDWWHQLTIAKKDLLSDPVEMVLGKLFFLRMRQIDDLVRLKSEARVTKEPFLSISRLLRIRFKTLKN